MKTVSKKIISLIISLIMIFSLFTFSASAANTIIRFSSNSLTVGETVTVTVTLNTGEAMYGVQCVVNYDNNIINYKSGNAVGGAGSVQIAEAPSGETKVSYTLTFTAVAAGSCTVSVTGCNYATQGANGAEEKGFSGASATLTVNDAALSSNANLSSLTLSHGSLSPKFSQSRTNYTVSVKNSVTECKIYATAADSGAKVEVSGESVLQIGNNIRTITVTAPSGAQKTYTITIVRGETEEEPPVEEEPVDTNENSLEANIEGVKHTVSTDISGVKLFEGFTATIAQFNSQDVAIATDSEGFYKIYYLMPAGLDTLIPYLFDEETQTFTKLKYFSQGEKTYIYADIPEGKTISEEYYATSVTIGGEEVKCYISNDTDHSDFYYIYCFSNGKYGFYRYDSFENVLQRYPELVLTDVEDTIADQEEEETFIDRFKSLSANAKTIIIAVVLVLIFSVILIVLLIIKFIKHRDQDRLIDDEDYDDEDFDGEDFGTFSLDYNEKK